MSAKPECHKWMPRAKGFCKLLEGHHGNCRHASVWYCDSCGKPHGGFPAASDPDAGSFCFMCMLDDWKHWGLIPRRPRVLR